MSDVTETANPCAREPSGRPRSQWLDFWDQFKHHKGAMIGGGFCIVITLAVFLGPFFCTIEPTFIDIRARNQGPSWAHPFGTDQLGRDMLARMLAGGQVSRSVGLTAMLLALFLCLIFFQPCYDRLHFNSSCNSIRRKERRKLVRYIN